MIITRWQAPTLPTKQQVLMMFEAEGLEAIEEILPPHSKIPDHRHSLDEIRMVVEGQMILDIAGNKMLLRAGDRVVIPSNTKHAKLVEADQPCLCICAQKAY